MAYLQCLINRFFITGYNPSEKNSQAAKVENANKQKRNRLKVL